MAKGTAMKPQTVSTTDLKALGCTPGSAAATFDSAVPALKAAGFNVSRNGSAGDYEVVFSTNMSVVGANPSSIYAQALLGPLDEGDTGLKRLYMIDGLYAIESREAIVTMICTPPEATYFSWETYVSARLSWPLRDLEPGPGAPISTLINSATLIEAHHRGGEPEWSPYNKSLVLVTTADAKTAERVVNVMRDVAPIKSDVLVVALNGTTKKLHFSHGPGHALLERPDLFQSLLRVHVRDPKASSIVEYTAHRYPVMRILPKHAAADVPLPPASEPRSAQGPGNEAGLEAAVALLKEAIIRQVMRSSNLTLVAEVGFTAIELNKSRCLTDPAYKPWRLAPRGCLGTVSDARYSISNRNLPLSTENLSLAVALGVDHVAMGNAASADLLAGTAVVITPEELLGSASHFLQRYEPRLFAYAFALDCQAPVASFAGRYCAPTPKEGSNTFGALRYEAYMDPATATRPSIGLVQPMALAFSARGVVAL